jgi:hypothetical protein
MDTISWALVRQYVGCEHTYDIWNAFKDACLHKSMGMACVEAVNARLCHLDVSASHRNVMLVQRVVRVA